MSIRALFFDFDGTLWDSESVGFRSWTEIWSEYGIAFPLEVYATMLGTVGGLDPIEELERRVGHPLERASIQERRVTRQLELLAGLGPRPGIEDYLRDARAAGLSLAIVSTDAVGWVQAEIV